MATGKKSFLLYADQIDLVEMLPDEIAGKLFKVIMQYVNDQEPQVDDLTLKLAFEPIKKQLKRDLKKYEGIIERNRENGAKGGRPPKPKVTQNNPVGFSETQPNPKKPDNDNDTVNVNDTVNDTDSILPPKPPKPPKGGKFKKPSIEECLSYAKEKGYTWDVEHFWNHHESKGWMVGKNKMKSWQSAMVTWDKNDKKFNKKQTDQPTTLHEWIQRGGTVAGFREYEQKNKQP